MLTARVSSKGQVVLPKRVRDELKVEPGTILEVSCEGGNIVLSPIGGAVGESLYGRYRREPLLDDIEAEHGEEIASDDRP